MAVSAITVAIATAIGEAILTAGADLAASEALAKIKAKLDQWRKQGKNEEIQHALDRARQDVLARCATDDQRTHVQRVLDTLFEASPAPLIEAFGALIKQTYSLAGTDQPSTTNLATIYRKVSSPAALERGEVPDQKTLAAIFQAFSAAFHEQLLREPTFSHLREYSQLATSRQQVNLQQTMVEHLEAIRTNTAHPIDAIPQLQSEYLAYLIDEIKELTLRGFAPQVSGKVLSLPLADVFLPLQATEGRPALATYAQEDLRHQAELVLMSEIDQQHYRAEMEKRFAQFQAHLAVQRTLKIADLLREPRVVILGDPGMGKTTSARYIAYALATKDARYIGSAPIGRIPILVRIALYAKALERDSTLHLIDYIQQELLPRSDFGKYIRAEIEAGRCLVILDGLDEVTNPSLRIQVTERIHATVATYSENHFLVTSRIVGYEQSPLTREFKHATVQALTAADQQRFIRMWYAAIELELGEQAAAGSAEDLIGTLERKPGIARIAANPLLLTIIVMMHWRGVTLPGRRVQVYQITTDTLIEHWTTLRDVEMDAEAMKAILAPIAHFILSRSVGGVIARHDLLPQLYAGIAAYHGYDQPESKRQGKSILKALSEQSGLFLERGYDDNQQPVYGFLHQTFGEYLAALHLANEIFSGTFSLSNYIHRAVWHEPLLLLAGHLSINSSPFANELVRDILHYPADFEDVLQRNALLAIECLADDIHVQPGLRQQILDTLAQIIHHDTPQVREAALTQYQRIAKTRHREAAVQSLKRVYIYDDSQDPPVFRKPVWLNVATALVYLGELDMARPIIWSISENRNVDTESFNASRRLRFEFWPEHAAEYLYQFITRARPPLITAGSDLERTVMVWLDAGLAYRVLRPVGFRHLLEQLITAVEHSGDRAALQWMHALVVESEITEPSDQSAQRLYCELLAPHIPAHIRCFAATRLLYGSDREEAIWVLQELVNDSYGQAISAAQALIEVGEQSNEIWQVIRDTAWMSQHFSAPLAIEALLKTRDTVRGLPAALHELATCQQGGWQSQRDERLHETVTALLRHGYTAVGLAAAQWLALRAGYKYRLDACELLLDHGLIKEAVPLLQYLAYECHDESSQRACQRLLVLREAERVVPLLGHVIQTGSPERRYRAALALALANDLPSTPHANSLRRTDLKVAILHERQLAYTRALDNLYSTGMRELDMISQNDPQARMTYALGVASLQFIQRTNCRAQADTQILPLDDTTPALQVCAAYFDLYSGAVAQARQRLQAVLTQPDEKLSIPVHIFALEALSEAAFADDVDTFIARLNHPNSTVRWSATNALLGRNAAVARNELIRALGDESSSVRHAAGNVLGQIPDPSVVNGLIAALSDADEGVQHVVKESLSAQGEQAIPPLMAILADKEHPLRITAMLILHQLHEHVPADYFIAALQDSDSGVRSWAARALGFMPETAATEYLVAALRDQDSNVQMRAAEALVRRGDEAALPHILTLLDTAEDTNLSSVIRDLEAWGDVAVPRLIAILNDERETFAQTATEALGKLRAVAAVPHLLDKLQSHNPSIRAAAIRALGRMQDPTIVELLIAGLRDEHSFVIEAGANALGELGDSIAVTPLLEVVADSSHFGRAAAVGSLAAFDDTVVFPTLITALSDEDENVRTKAAEALGKVRQSDAVYPLITCLADDTSSVRSAAAAALANLEHQDTVPSLCNALDDADMNVRSQAAETLGKLGDSRAKLPLMWRMIDPEEHSRLAATVALGQLGAIEAGELLETARLPSDLFALEGVMWRAEVLIRLRPAGALAVMKYRRHHFRLIPWLEKVLTGQALWSIGEQEAALKELIDALALESNTSTLLPVGHFYIETGDVKSAANYIQRAVDEKPKEPACLLSQSVILWQQKVATEAIDYFRQAQSVDPDIVNLDILRSHLWRTQALASVEAIRKVIEGVVPL